MTGRAARVHAVGGQRRRRAQLARAAVTRRIAEFTRTALTVLRAAGIRYGSGAANTRLSARPRLTHGRRVDQIAARLAVGQAALAVVSAQVGAALVRLRALDAILAGAGVGLRVAVSGRRPRSTHARGSWRGHRPQAAPDRSLQRRAAAQRCLVAVLPPVAVHIDEAATLVRDTHAATRGTVTRAASARITLVAGAGADRTPAAPVVATGVRHTFARRAARDRAVVTGAGVGHGVARMSGAGSNGGARRRGVEAARAAIRGDGRTGQAQRHTVERDLVAVMPLRAVCVLGATLGEAAHPCCCCKCVSDTPSPRHSSCTGRARAAGRTCRRPHTHSRCSPGPCTREPPVFGTRLGAGVAATARARRTHVRGARTRRVQFLVGRQGAAPGELGRTAERVAPAELRRAALVVVPTAVRSLGNAHRSSGSAAHAGAADARRVPGRTRPLAVGVAAGAVGAAAPTRYTRWRSRMRHPARPHRCSTPDCRRRSRTRSRGCRAARRAAARAVTGWISCPFARSGAHLRLGSQ